MILLVPYPNFVLSASVLLDRDLFEMNYNSLAILQIMAGNHPPSATYYRSVVAWLRYPRALLRYYNALSLEWERRGYEPVFERIFTSEQAEENGIQEKTLGKYYLAPQWLGWEELHSAHRGYLTAGNKHYWTIWNDRHKVTGMVWPGIIPPPGKFLVKGDLTALVVQVHKWYLEVLINREYRKLEYADVERKIWVPDHLPLHERFQMEYGNR